MPETVTPPIRPPDASTGFMNKFAAAMAEETPQVEPKTVEVTEENTPKPSTNITANKPAEVVANQGKSEEMGTRVPTESDDKWPRTAQEWKKFRAARDERIAKLEAQNKEAMAALETERKKVVEPPAPPSDYEEVKKERDNLSETIRLISVTEHPKFKAYFDNKISAQVDLAKRLVGTELSGRVEAILKMPDSDYKTAQMEDIVSEMSPLKQGQIASVINALSQIGMERDSEVSKAKENYESMQKVREDSRKAHQSGIEKAFQSALARLQDKDTGIRIFQSQDGDDSHNQEVAKRVEAAKSLIFGSPKPEMFIQSALNAAAYPAVLAALQQQDSEIEKLHSQIAELTKATPKIQGGKQPTESPAGEASNPRLDVKKGARPMDVSAAWMKGLPND